MTTVGDLRILLRLRNAKWTIDERLTDGQDVPRYATGVDRAGAQRISEITRVDISPYLAEPTSNLFLLQLREAGGFLKRERRSRAS